MKSTITLADLAKTEAVKRFFNRGAGPTPVIAASTPKPLAPAGLEMELA